MSEIFERILPHIGVWVLFSIIFLTELLCYLIGEPINSFSFIPFAGSSVLTFIMLYVLVDIVSLFPRNAGKWLSGVLGLILSLTVISGVVVFMQFGEFVTPSKIQFFTNNFDYTLAFAKSFLAGIFGIFYLIFAFLFAFVVYQASNNLKLRRKSYKKDAILLPVLILVYFVVMNQYSHHLKNYMTDIHTSLVCAVKSVKRKIPKGFTRCNIREIPEKFTPTAKYNVLLIINESFGREAFCFNDSTSMPLLKCRLQNCCDRSMTFSNAFASSSATEISVSSLLTGVAPYEPKRQLYKLPLAWQWFDAAGYRTAYISAQKFLWMGFDIFIDKNPDVKISADNIKLPLINDGIDDGYMFRKVESELAKAMKNGRFFFVYNTNALHNPFMQKSKYLDFKPKFSSKLKNAAAILDVVIDSVLTYLDDNKVLDSTIVIITGDHGECDQKIHKQNRIESYYDEFQQVPLTMILPKPLADHYRGVLNGNKNQITGNLDILPTLLSFLTGDKYSEKNYRLVKQFSGRTLTRPISDGRFIISLNTNDIRSWDREGFGIFFKDFRFTFHDVNGSELFNIKKDPTEQHSIWQKCSENQKNRIKHIIFSVFQLRRMYTDKSRS